MKKCLYAAAGFLVLIGLGILGRPGRAAEKAGQQRDDLLLDGSGKAEHKAHLAGIKADKHQRNALKAAEAGQKAIDKAGQNESMAELLDNWHKHVDGL